MGGGGPGPAGAGGRHRDPVGIDQGAAGLIWQLAPLGILGLLACWTVWVAVQVPRYRRSSGERRLQLKWLYSGGVIFLVSLTVTVVQPGSTSLTWGIITGVAAAGLAAQPVAVAIGILKFRLYDIDRIISRTLSYALVTGLIVGVYAGAVLLATHVLPVSGSVSVAASTLIAAVLVNPLRRRGPAACRPAVQPGALRRRGDGGRLRGPAARVGGPGLGSGRTDRGRPAGLRAYPRLGLALRSPSGGR